MSNLLFKSKSISFVSLLSSFVLVVITGFIFFSSTSTLQVKAQVDTQSSTGQAGEASGRNREVGAAGAGAGVGQAGRDGSVGPRANSLVEFDTIVKQSEVTGDINLESFGKTSFEITGLSATCALVPCGAEVGRAGRDAGAGPRGTSDSSLTGSMSKMIGYMFTEQPASTYIAVADFMNNAGIEVAPPAYAQEGVGGLGFAALSPVLNAWKTFRNIAFLFFVIIILVIGFMIMFRQKVGQSAVTAQQAIPRVVIALLTVSFSYAIAGILIDGMYILMTLMIYVFGLGEQESILLGSNSLDLGWRLVTSGAETSFEAIATLVDSISPVNLPLDIMAGFTVGLVVAIAIVFSMFRLFFELLKTYVTIIISITIAPMLLMLGAIPGRDVFGKWLKGLVGNLAAFPIVLLVLILYDQLTGTLSGPRPEVMQGGFSPPYLFGTIESGGVAQFFIGMGLLLIMTDLVKQGKKAFGADEGVFGQFATAFGDSLKKGWTGGELIPGLALSDTRKWGKKTFGGVSGQNVVNKGATLLGGAAGGTLGAYDQMRRERAARGSALRGFGSGAVRGAKATARMMGDEHLKEWANPEKKPNTNPPKATS